MTITKEIEVAEREQDKLFATGNPFELGSKARAAKEDLEKLSQEEGKLADMHNKLQTAYDGVNDKINEYSQKADEATASTSRLSRIGGMVGKAIGSIATFGKNAAKSLTGAKKSSSGFGLSLGTLVKYGFGIRSLYVLVAIFEFYVQKGVNMAIDKRGRKLPKGIRQRGNTFEGRFMYKGVSYTVQASTITKTQKEMTDLKYKLEHGLYVKKEKITLMEWYETWLEEYKKNRVKIGTYTSYEKYYKSTINNRLGNKELSEIRGEHIQKLYNDMVKEGYAISSIKIVSAILNGCLQQAMKNGLIERNPVKLAELPRQTGTKKERTAMTKEQQDLFMKYAEESYLYHFFSVMLRTGMRKGEMQGLKYSDIDKKQNVIHVRSTLKYIEGKGYFEDTPKTRTSTRDIPLTAAITEHIEAQRKYWGFKVVRMDQYLFCNENGDPISRERIQGEIDRIIKRIKSDGYDFPRITSHVFRHTFATRAIEAGMPPQVLKTILGHSSLAMTMDLYSHVLPDTKADEMQKIANVF